MLDVNMSDSLSPLFDGFDEKKGVPVSKASDPKATHPCLILHP